MVDLESDEDINWLRIGVQCLFDRMLLHLLFMRQVSCAKTAVYSPVWIKVYLCFMYSEISHLICCPCFCPFKKMNITMLHSNVDQMLRHLKLLNDL